MREFIIILVIAFANAEKLGYHYASSGGGGSHHSYEGRFRHRGSQSHYTTSTPQPSSTATIENVRLNGFAGDTRSGINGNFPQNGETEYNKVFFSYNAPEEDYQESQQLQRLMASMRKNLRVVFIKAPENNGLTNAALQLAKHTTESKTSIYVLTKQPDINELAQQINNIQHDSSSKPEVHFVKYRTPEDALRAQQIIQQEYDLLSGPSRVSNEGAANVLDFASRNVNKNFDLPLGAANSVSLGVSNIAPLSTNAYLPPRAT